VVGVVAALVLLAVAVGALTGGGDDGDDLAADPTGETATTLPPDTVDPGTSPPLPSLPIDPGQPGTDPEQLARPLEEVLPEIIDFVEQTRGHEFVTDPVVEAVAEAEFEERLADTSEADEDALRTDQTALRGMGIIDPDTDLVDATRTAGAGGVLGFYQPATGELLVKGDVVTPLVQTVIAHELTHALDDQIFDLSRLDELATRPDESAFGLVSVVEGTARWVEYQYREQMSPEEQGAVQTEELELGMDQMDLLDLPLPLLVQTQIPYSVGHTFVSALVDEGGLDLLDVAVQRPPTTSEQVLDLDVFLERQPATRVADPQPASGGTAVDRGAFGAVDLRMLEVVADPVGAAAALTGQLEPVDGYGGGRYVSWTSAQGEDCVTIHVVGDEGPGAAEVDRVMTAWAASMGADLTTGFGMQVATSCV
jgi:hypothetical protein